MMDNKNTDLSKIISQNNIFSDALKKVLIYVETGEDVKKKEAHSVKKRSRKNNK
jgi:hypothetical protein